MAKLIKRTSVDLSALAGISKETPLFPLGGRAKRGRPKNTALKGSPKGLLVHQSIMKAMNAVKKIEKIEAEIRHIKQEMEKATLRQQQILFFFKLVLDCNSNRKVSIKELLQIMNNLVQQHTSDISNLSPVESDREDTDLVSNLIKSAKSN